MPSQSAGVEDWKAGHKMAVPLYVVMSSEVVIDSTNGDIVVKAGGLTETLTIAPGSYYFTGESASSLADRVAEALETHTNIAVCTATNFLFEINDDNTPTCSVTFAAGSSFELLVLSGGTTFDWELVGFSAASAAGTDAVSDCEIKGLWVADQPAENEVKGPFATDISQDTALDGSVYTFKRGSAEQIGRAHV